uniref:Uncharacterized protein n=1 Tax=Anguilla anguilla TaxID=7936 RepID=A0A0E9XCV8_ANGAN
MTDGLLECDTCVIHTPNPHTSQFLDLSSQELPSFFTELPTTVKEN